MTKPTVEELECLLNSEDDSPVHIMPDGSIIGCSQRNTVIEECAQVAEGFKDDWGGCDWEAIAAAIRALKEKSNAV